MESSQYKGKRDRMQKSENGHQASEGWGVHLTIWTADGNYFVRLRRK